MHQAAWDRKVSKDQIRKYSKVFVWKTAVKINLTINHMKHFKSINDIGSWCKDNFNGRFRVNNRKPTQDEFAVNISPPITTIKHVPLAILKQGMSTGPLNNIICGYVNSSIHLLIKGWKKPFVHRLNELYMLECEDEDDAVLFELIFS